MKKMFTWLFYEIFLLLHASRRVFLLSHVKHEMFQIIRVKISLFYYSFNCQQFFIAFHTMFFMYSQIYEPQMPLKMRKTDYFYKHSLTELTELTGWLTLSYFLYPINVFVVWIKANINAICQLFSIILISLNFIISKFHYENIKKKPCVRIKFNLTLVAFFVVC